MEDLSERGDEYDGPVSVVMVEGAPLFVPRGVKLSGESLRAAAALNLASSELREAQARLLDALRYARDSGLSWANVGFYLGTSGEAARQRFASAVDAPSTARRKDKKGGSHV
jgi:hypothetical protein